MGDAIASVLIVAGAVLVLLASVGVNRFGNVFARMHAATKAATLGLLLIVAGAATQVEHVAGTAKLVLVVALQLLTAPIAAHLVGRAAYRADGPSPGNTVDELAPVVEPGPHPDPDG